MISMEDVRAIHLLAELTEQMQEKMRSIAKLKQFKEGELVYEEGDRAKNLYMLKRGTILLEVEVSKEIIISLGSIKSGDLFGWSALIPGSAHTNYAVCVESCDVIVTPGEKFLDLLKTDHTMGYRIMIKVMEILKKRLDRRTGQFLKVMSKHPDIQKLLGL